MSLGAGELRRLMAEHGVQPSRALGQHFVADPNTVRRIVRLAGIDAGSRVVEVGAGLGSLTLALAAAAGAAGDVVAIEVDRFLVPVLRSVVEGCANVRVVEADALTLRWQELLDGARLEDEVVASDDGRRRNWSLVANLPYNVATPLVVRVLEEAPQVTSMLVMVQREVGERLAAAPGGREYGAVSVKVAYWSRAAVVGTVPPTVFVPQPAVESALVRITRRAEPAVPSAAPYDRLFALVRAGFSQRRKMLRRSLAGVVTPDAFAAADIDPSARAEQLSVEEWGRLAAVGCEGSVAG